MTKELSKFAALNNAREQNKLIPITINDNLDNTENIQKSEFEFRDLGAAAAKKDSGEKSKKMERIRSFIITLKKDRIKNLDAIYQETNLSSSHITEVLELRKRLLEKERSLITLKEVQNAIIKKSADVEFTDLETQQIDASVAWANKAIELIIEEKVALIDKLLEAAKAEISPAIHDRDKSDISGQDTSIKASKDAEEQTRLKDAVAKTNDNLEGQEISPSVSNGNISEKKKNKFSSKSDIGAEKIERKPEKAKSSKETVKTESREIDSKSITEEKLKRNIELKSLFADVTEARKEYLEMYYKKKSAYANLKKFFGGLISNSDSEGHDREDQEVSYYRKLYLNKLVEYRTLFLESEKMEGDSGKEIGDRYKLMELNENIALAETNIDVRFDNYDSGFSQFIKECNNDLSEKWNNLHWAKKVGIGYAVFVPGALIIGAGPVMLAGIGGVMIKKILESVEIKKIYNKKKEKIEKSLNHNFSVIDLEQGANLDPRILAINERLGELNKEIAVTDDNDKQDKLRAEKMHLETTKDNFRYITNVASMRIFLAGKNKNEWPKMSKRPVSDLAYAAEKKISIYDPRTLESRFYKIYKNLKNEEVFKDKLQPINDKETLDEWIKRMSIVAYESKISSM